MYRVTDEENNFYALKVVDMSLFHGDKKMLMSFLNEIKIMRTIEHPRILRLFDKIIENNIVMLITNFCDGGNLEEFVMKWKGLGEKEATFYLKQICEGF